MNEMKPGAGPQALREWLRATPSTLEQHPVDELLAEHHLMAHVIAAMEKEAGRLAGGQPMRADFWAGVVDFVGNFVHLCHRKKEEQHLFLPRRSAGESVPAQNFEDLKKEHKRAEDMTPELCEAIETADWEQALRLVHVYIHAMRRHMQREEEQIFAQLKEGLSSDETQEMRKGFTAAERTALSSGKSRRAYAQLASDLCKQAEVLDPLAR